MTLHLKRTVSNKDCTIGELTDSNNLLICYMLEPPEYGLPCRIKSGIYRCTHYRSPRLKGADTWLLHGVPGRSMIEIHTGNYPGETRGCLLPGMSVAQNKKAVYNSKVAINKITSAIGGWGVSWELEIK